MVGYEGCMERPRSARARWLTDPCFARGAVTQPTPLVELAQDVLVHSVRQGSDGLWVVAGGVRIGEHAVEWGQQEG